MASAAARAFSASVPVSSCSSARWLLISSTAGRWVALPVAAVLEALLLVVLSDALAATVFARMPPPATPARPRARSR